jgi:transcription-repair coupling factor (superfamily II helicase)
MKVLTKPLWEMGEMEEVHHLLLDKKGSVLVSGCADSQKLHMAYGLSDGFSCKIIVTFSDQRVKEIYEDYKIYDKNVMMFPGKDLIFYQADIHGNQLITERMKCYRRILSDPNVTIVTTFHALMTPQVPLQVMKDSCILFSKNKVVDSSKLALKLISMGYDKTYQVEGKGQFSIRGGIIDIFDLTEENPYRIELWGDDVDSIQIL